MPNKAGIARLPEAHRPRIEEDDQDIQGQEDQGVEIVAEVELHPGLADGLHAALEVLVLGGVGAARYDLHPAEGGRKDNRSDGKTCGDNQKQRDIAVISQQCVSLRLPGKSAEVYHTVTEKTRGFLRGRWEGDLRPPTGVILPHPCVRERPVSFGGLVRKRRIAVLRLLDTRMRRS